MELENSPTTFTAKIAADHQEAANFIVHALSWMHRNSEENLGLVDAGVILRELLRNAVIHGSGNNRNKSIWCRIENCEHGQFSIDVEDQGDGFDVAQLFLNLPANPLQESACGLKLVNALADHLSFNERGNRATAYVTVCTKSLNVPIFSGDGQ